MDFVDTLTEIYDENYNVKRSYDDHMSTCSFSTAPSLMVDGQSECSRRLSKLKMGKHWGHDEDQRLRKAVELYGELDWVMICKYVGTRDNVQCRQRWQKTLRPGLQRGKWTEEEDEKLRECMEMKLGSWTLVAQRLDGRTSKQCRERWNHHICPDVNKAAFSTEEDEKLKSLYSEFGNQWSRISKMIEGRTESMVRTRMLLLDKKIKEEEGTDLPMNPPAPLIAPLAAPLPAPVAIENLAVRIAPPSIPIYQSSSLDSYDQISIPPSPIALNNVASQILPSQMPVYQSFSGDRYDHFVVTAPQLPPSQIVSQWNPNVIDNVDLLINCWDPSAENLELLAELDWLLQ